MQIGLVGLGRMGAQMVERLLRAGHSCVVFDTSKDAMEAVAKFGATTSSSLGDMVDKLKSPVPCG